MEKQIRDIKLEKLLNKALRVKCKEDFIKKFYFRAIYRWHDGTKKGVWGKSPKVCFINLNNNRYRKTK